MALFKTAICDSTTGIVMELPKLISSKYCPNSIQINKWLIR